MDKVKVNVGDRVRAERGCGRFFPAGAVGVVNLIDSDGDVWIEFDPGQAGVHYNDGVWCAGPDSVTKLDDE